MSEVRRETVDAMEGMKIEDMTLEQIYDLELKYSCLLGSRGKFFSPKDQEEKEEK